MLSELEQDALTELVNIAVSGSAVRLRTMVGAEVLLTVPATALVPGEEAAMTMERLGLASFTGVRQTFTGRLEGQTLLIFPQPSHDELIRLVLDDEVSPEEFEELRADALGEIGNVLLVGFLSSIGNMLRVDFDVSTPAVATGSAQEVFEPGRQETALFIYVNFNVRGRTVRGYFALVLGLASFLLLRQILQSFIQQVS